MVRQWNKLQVGDRIRIVRIPSEFSQSGYQVHSSAPNRYGLKLGIILPEQDKPPNHRASNLPNRRASVN